LKGSKDTVLKITTDKLAAYQNAIKTVFSDVAHVYMQVVKRRKNKRLVTVKKWEVFQLCGWHQKYL
jgi:hypothetical protein